MVFLMSDRDRGGGLDPGGTIMRKRGGVGPIY